MADDRGVLGHVQDAVTTAGLVAQLGSPLAGPPPPSDLAPPPEPFATVQEADAQSAAELNAALTEQRLERDLANLGEWEALRREQEIEAQGGGRDGFEGPGAGAL